MKESDFHFFMYLKYVMYDWIKALTCCEPDWEDCKKIDSAREEAVEQVDVQLLLKRISHLEHINKYYISPEEDFCSYLTEGQHFEDLKKRRMVINYYKKITGGNLLLTMENMNMVENVFNLATEMPLKSMNGTFNERS